MMRFEHNWVLHGLWALPVMIILFWFYRRWKQKRLRDWGDDNVTVNMMPWYSPNMLTLKFILFAIAYSSLVIALANPQQGSRIETAKRKGIDIIVALDISNSMLATDITPNRLERTKQSVQRFVNNLNGDRIGIVVFAGKAVRVLPITADYAAANMIISNINTRMIGTQGTAIGAAIESAIEGFSKDEKRNRVIIVVSDGENHEDDAVAASENAFKQGIFVYSIGIGTPAGSPIPVSETRTGDFRKDRDGTTVISRMNEVMLQKIAGAGNGKYYSGMLAVSGFNALAEDLDKLEKTETESRVYSDYESRYQYALGLALLLLIIENITGERKVKRPDWLKNRLKFNKAVK
jgi:Ca-activated chloride channel family protein